MVAINHIAQLSRIRSNSYKTDTGAIRAFQRIVLSFYEQHGRDFVWRRTHDPYEILVSEVMLQQTQTARIVERYPLFLRQFPTVQKLAQARQAEVLRAWQGLGYYRRARNLHQAAQAVVCNHGGCFPRAFDELHSLPGVGAYTAAAVAVFAYGQAVPMLETNIRTVFIYTFFQDCRDIRDSEIMEYVAKTLVTERSRDWFYALMDLGVELKRLQPRINQASKHYAAQSRFEGSDRQVAARILRFVLQSSSAVSVDTITRDVHAAAAKVERAIERLAREGMIVVTKEGRVRPS